MASWPLFYLFATLSFIFLIYRSSLLQTFKLHNKQDLEQQYSIVDSHLSVTLLVTCSPSSVSTASYFEHTWYGPAEYCLEDEKGRERQRPMTLKSSPQSRLSDAYMLMMMVNWNRAFVFCNGIVRPLSRTPIKENIYIYMYQKRKKERKNGLGTEKGIFITHIPYLMREGSDSIRACLELPLASPDPFPLSRQPPMGLSPLQWSCGRHLLVALIEHPGQ
jgi:hypothetical protein